jgi:hypothetical protein
MKQASLPLPVIGMIAGTRGMLGAGIGLLLADRLHPRHRRTVGWTLLVLGALSTVPLLLRVRGSLSDPPLSRVASPPRS